MKINIILELHVPEEAEEENMYFDYFGLDEKLLPLGFIEDKRVNEPFPEDTKNYIYYECEPDVLIEKYRALPKVEEEV